jgi:hypothetical protein
MVLVGTGHAISEKFAAVLYCLKMECASPLTAGSTAILGRFFKNQDVKRALGIIVSKHLSKCLK